jgi:hypothetical protein
MPSEGLRAQAQRALQKVSHGKKSPGTAFPLEFQGHNPAVPLSQALGLGRFLARWGQQAEALGWTSRDLFGLHKPPANTHASYSRLSRYDETGLTWLLCGREVVALTEATAAIQNPTGAITTYRRFNRPALGPVGDSLDDLGPPFGGSAA